jgi:hypothetical protein
VITWIPTGIGKGVRAPVIVVVAPAIVVVVAAAASVVLALVPTVMTLVVVVVAEPEVPVNVIVTVIDWLPSITIEPSVAEPDESLSVTVPPLGSATETEHVTPPFKIRMVEPFFCIEAV